MFGFRKKGVDPTSLVGGVKKKAQPNPTNWQFASHPKCKATSQKALPKQVNLKKKFGPVYTQTYGNCTSNAVLACDAYYYHDPASTWVPSAVFTYYVQRVLIEKDLPQSDSGSTVEVALDAVRKWGACNAKVWPNTKPYDKKPSKKAFENGLKGKELTSYYNVKSLLQIKKALSSNYPVAGVVTWAFKNYDENTFIMNDPTKKEINDAETSHAIVIVGYDDEKELFEIRNSWGPKWANQGYAYITYSTMKNIIEFDDSYAVVK